MAIVGGRLLSLRGILRWQAIFLLKMSARMLFNDVPCSLPYSAATNLRHESLTSPSDADRSPRQRLSVNIISLFNTVALPIPADSVTPTQSVCSKEIGNYCIMLLCYLIDINNCVTSRHLSIVT